MLLAADTLYFLPVLLAFIVGVATFILVFVKSISGAKVGFSLAYLAIPSLLMTVFTLGYLFGPDCVFCTEGGRLRGLVEYSTGVALFGLICVAIVWCAGRPDS